MFFELDKAIQKHADLLSAFPELKVTLIDYSRNPYNLSIASARTCYSSKGLVYPEDMEKSEKSRNLRDRIARSTLEAGHVTTRQHAHFVFGIEGLSRNAIWQFLHAHPYYNSEQVSQRYVPIKEGEWFSLPKSMRTESVREVHNILFEGYRSLTEKLMKPVSEIYFDIFRARKSFPDRYEKDIQKKTMEVARYLMPLSTTAYMYHTISALTLYRYVRMMETGLSEVTALVLKMAMEVQKVDPLLIAEVPAPLSGSEKNYDPADAVVRNRNFDARLKEKNLRSLLVSFTKNAASLAEEILKTSSGSNEELSTLLDAEKNPYLSDSLYPVTLDEKSRTLNHIQFTFMKKLSHTADSQEQRHRTLPGSRPDLAQSISLENDYIVPGLLEEIPALKKEYVDLMEQVFEKARALYKDGVSMSDLTYLMPNALPVRFYESGDYLNFFHKWKSRLCYNAQEEIFYSALDEMIQVEKAEPQFKGFIGAPCVLRKTTKPRCPEGDRYCGIKVWKLSPSEYRRLI